MKINRFALVAGLLALGAAACGDDVQVVEPTPPVPPPPPPVEATMAPSSASVAAGNSVVFAVNASGGVAGEAASWTCASSNTGIATVSVTSTGCQATGVAAGDVTITASVSKSGETVNVGAQLTVTEYTEPTAQPGDPAFIILASVKDNTENDDTLSGRVTATVNVERGDQELEEVALLVDGEVVASQSFGSDMDMGMAPPEDDAAEQAVHAFTLSFNSAGYDDHGHVDYTNGDHTISATLEIGITMADGMHGHETLSSNAITFEFDNDDAVHASVSGLGDGALNTSTGQVWHGGPDAAIAVTAMPVLYSGGDAAAVTLRQFCGGDAITDAEAPYEFSPKCGKNYVTSAAKGDSLTFSIGGDDVSKVVGADKLFLDFDGPGAPTFKPNPNGREDGWINAAVGITSTSGGDSWLNKVGEDTNGVGGYAARLRYVAKPKSGSHAKAAVAAAASTSLPAENKTKDVYCVFASATDRLGNESALPKADDATCVIAGVAADTMGAGTDDDVAATGYQELLADAAASGATAATKAKLTNAGILAGVDLTAPTVEFLSSAAKDKATSLGTEGTEAWGLHLSDKLGMTHSKPLEVSIKVRDTSKTTTFKQRKSASETSPAADSFVVTTPGDGETGAGFRHTVSILGGGHGTASEIRQGYYTFSATAKDKAGNKSAPVSRVALHDGTAPPAPGLFLTPATGGGYNSIIVLTEDLSIRNYSTAVVLPTIGAVTDPELVAETGNIDAYNAASLTTSKTVQGTVNLPYKALQDDTSSEINAVDDFKVYATNQAKTSASATNSVSVSTSGITALAFRSGSDGLTVTTHGATGTAAVNTFPATGSNSKSMKVKVVADMTDNAASINAPFSAVGLYAQVRVGPEGSRVNQLRQIGIIPVSAAKTALTDDGRTWTYEATLPLDAVYAVVKDDANIATSGDSAGNYAGRIVAFGVAAKGLVVAEDKAEDVTINKR